MKQILKLIADSDVWVMIPIMLIILIDVFGDMATLKFLRLCGVFAVLFSGFGYIEVYRIRRRMEERR